MEHVYLGYDLQIRLSPLIDSQCLKRREISQGGFFNLFYSVSLEMPGNKEKKFKCRLTEFYSFTERVPG